MMDDEILLTRHIIPENTEEAKRTLIDMASSKEMMLHDVPTFIFDHIALTSYYLLHNTRCTLFTLCTYSKMYIEKRRNFKRIDKRAWLTVLTHFLKTKT